MLDGLQPFHLGIREIGKQGVAVVQSRCYESLYYAPCRICCDITADRRQPVEMEVASFAHLHTTVTCLSMVKCWSICTPRFLTHSLLAVVSKSVTTGCLWLCIIMCDGLVC